MLILKQRTLHKKAKLEDYTGEAVPDRKTESAPVHAEQNRADNKSKKGVFIGVICAAAASVLVIVIALQAGNPAEKGTVSSSSAASSASAGTRSGNENTDSAGAGTVSGDSTGYLVYATSTFGREFSPFFATTAYDMEVVDMTQGAALAADRGGAVIEHGIEGETINYNGTDYTYYGMGDVDITQNDDGSVDYQITIRDDLKFSDGEPITIDDYIFSFYVFVDPTYDGSTTLYALPIEGMEEYRSGMESKIDLILATEEAGYEENEYFTQEEYDPV